MKVSILKSLSNEIEKLLIDLKVHKNFQENEKENIISYLTTALTDYDDISEESVESYITFYISINYKAIYQRQAIIINDDTVIRHHEQMISHVFDCTLEELTAEPYATREKKVKELLKLPATVQGSIPWLEERMNCLTATAISTALDENPYEWPIMLFLDKTIAKVKFAPTIMTHHGNKYENIINMVYSYRNNVVVAEFGMIRHKKIAIVAASPDGICTSSNGNKGNTKLVGRLVEIKCPYVRKILSTGKLDGEIIPHYYYVQVQVQLAVTDLDECMFVQCKIEEYPSWDIYVKDTNPYLESLSNKYGMERGCVIRLQPRDGTGVLASKYLYPDKLHMINNEVKQWIADQAISFESNELAKTHYWDKPLFWKVTAYQENLVKREENWVEDRLKTLQRFWDYIEFFRTHPKKTEKIMKMLDQDCPEAKDGKRKISFEQNAKYFKHIHEEFLKENDVSFKPLYQTPSDERVKIMEKYGKK